VSASFWLGVVLFALGILVSICLHEAGHLITAKRFGMKATKYFAGFGPTLWSFRRGETEYGLKAIPAGGFVKIVGMTPMEDDVSAEDAPRAFWRQPTWKRTVVLVAGSFTHFVLAVVIFYLAAVTTGLPNAAASDYDPFQAPPVIGAVSDCVIQDFDTARRSGDCRPGDPEGPAKAAGLRSGDRVLSVDGKRIGTYGDLVTVVRATPPGPTRVTYERAGQVRTVTVDLVATERPPVDDVTGEVRTVSAIGIGADTTNAPPPILHYSAASAVPGALSFTGFSIGQTFEAIAGFPQRVPKLIDAITGEQRDPTTPISVVGASRIGGEAVELGAPIIFLALLGGLNLFIGIFNLFPLLPLDGGHVAIIWYERARSWIAARRGRPDPGRVDYNKLLPVTYLVLLLFGGLTLLTLAADIVNPIRL